MDKNSFLVLIYANHENAGLQNLQKTLKRNGYPYKIIGMNTKFKNFSSLIKSMVKELEAQMKLNPKKKIIKLDGFDMLALQPYQYFLKTYNRINSTDSKGRMIFCGEIWHLFYSLYFSTNLDAYFDSHHLKKQNATCPLVNAGCAIGTAEQLFDLYNFLLEQKYQDDQRGFIQYINLYPYRVYLETECKFVYNATRELLDAHPIQENTYCVPSLKTYPIFVHVPGAKFCWGHNNLQKWNRLVLGDDCEIYPTDCYLHKIIVLVFFSLFVVLLITIFFIFADSQKYKQAQK